ncbi:Uncharacterized membrane-anchored protein [Lentibacillus halodurans]|uniref:Uncharacterized membrane-anchored protein n=1 Tax=Lentibacillus halodurans TaxID=237679 RepID=A0A1I0ZJS6_9BACI|nr:hypothetical protein [Lentibacillus halodurans]SFB25904.1 Uncharacterized membrane-anchored protein [Lentibacillus halodurans]
MPGKTELSTKSREFLEDLRVYLFSNGKNSDDIQDIVEELEVHLMEAEKEGKSVEKIIGHSPKEYMEQLSNELAADYKSWFKYVMLIILGSFSFSLANDLFEGTLSYSVLELIGHVVLGVIFIFGMLMTFKYIVGNKLSKWKELSIFFVLGIIPIGLFVGLTYINRAVETPMIYFGTAGTILTAVITVVFLIAVSWWAKTWVLPIVLTMLLLPEYLFRLTAMVQETQMILSTVASFGGIGVYMFIDSKMNKAS